MEDIFTQLKYDVGMKSVEKIGVCKILKLDVEVLMYGGGCADWSNRRFGGAVS